MGRCEGFLSWVSGAVRCPEHYTPTVQSALLPQRNWEGSKPSGVSGEHRLSRRGRYDGHIQLDAHVLLFCLEPSLILGVIGSNESSFEEGDLMIKVA